jgi:hypothetical protein
VTRGAQRTGLARRRGARGRTPIWEPLLDAADDKPDAVTHFAGALWRAMLTAGPDDETITALLGRASDPGWAEPPFDLLVIALAGLTVPSFREDRHASVLEAIRGQWLACVRPRIRSPLAIRFLAVFLARPAAEPVRASALP